MKSTEDIRKLSQEERVYDVLLNALNGKIRHPLIQQGWVNKQYFVRVMGFTQAGRAIHNLEKKLTANGTSEAIEHSSDTDEYGFKSYRLSTNGTLF